MLKELPGAQIQILENYIPVTSGHALAGAVQTNNATTRTANTRASLSQGAYGCMRAKSNFTMSPPFV
jgi:hypothetical protein